MTGPAGNSEFFFPRPSTFGVEGKQISLFPVGLVISVLLYSKIEKKNVKKYLFDGSWHNKFAAISRCTT